MGMESDKRKVYLESSTISYLTARPTRDIVVNAKQELTREWWEYRNRYEMFVSETVAEEIEKGDLEAARLRLQTIQGIPVLGMNGNVERLAETILTANAIPDNSGADARHGAFAAVFNMDVFDHVESKTYCHRKKEATNRSDY